MMPRLSILFVAALVAGASYYANRWIGIDASWTALWKGGCVALLALWAAANARHADGWMFVAVLALHALGDVLLDTHGLTVGAMAFLAGHLLAALLYLRNRRGPLWHAAVIAGAVALLSWALPADRAAAPGIALYALGLGVMAGAARISRFSTLPVSLGALLFVVSDMLIFAQLGPLAASPLPGLLIWPTYVGAQALIAWGVVGALAREARR